MDNSRLDFITFDRFYRLSERRMRISVDLDRNNILQDKLVVLKAYFSLKSGFRKSTVKVDRTGHGFHVKAVGLEIEKIPMSSRVAYRETLGDDPMRLDWDQTKLQNNMPVMCETLFTMKRGHDQKLHIVEEIDPLALPYASRIPAKKWVSKHGKQKNRT